MTAGPPDRGAPPPVVVLAEPGGPRSPGSSRPRGAARPRGGCGSPTLCPALAVQRAGTAAAAARRAPPVRGPRCARRRRFLVPLPGSSPTALAAFIRETAPWAVLARARRSDARWPAAPPRPRDRARGRRHRAVGPRGPPRGGQAGVRRRPGGRHHVPQRHTDGDRAPGRAPPTAAPAARRSGRDTGARPARPRPRPVRPAGRRRRHAGPGRSRRRRGVRHRARGLRRARRARRPARG